MTSKTQISKEDIFNEENVKIALENGVLRFLRQNKDWACEVSKRTRGRT